ncbi:DUF4314 domain-containing protein [Krasilnikovia sp. MM14-A1004]|uniref:DUF4314 domain-containing protein n=1 Tax=Krasilnikovia sp. MM14-A1004 TaxID=3373541 RepID=UPI00399C6381
MTIYQPGQRVALVHTIDPHTDLRPGDAGTVRRHDQHLHIVHVDWDSGSSLSMCLDAGDRVELLDPAAAGPQPSGDTDGWTAALARLRAAGAEAGRGAADWWAQDTIGGRATGDVRAIARRILAGIDDGDPAVLDGLPTFTPQAYGHDDRDTAQGRYTEATQGQMPHWRDLTDVQRAETIDAFQEAFEAAVLERVTALCHLAASPTGADVSHLHPSRVRVGGVGVFAGDWAWTADTSGADRIAVGFVGTLIDRWNGWAVFSCTREVAEAIVADQQEQRRDLRESLHRHGVPEPDLDRQVNMQLTELRFDGDVIIADQRAQCDDPEAIEHISPSRDGRYVVMGWNWCWQAVDPYDCDRILGDLPNPGHEQDFELLRHTPGMRVPHTRLQLTNMRYQPVSTGLAFTATLALDGRPLATVTDDGAGAPTLDPADLTAIHDGLRAYLGHCRFHGSSVDMPRLLQALADEHFLSHAVAQAEVDGGTQLRLVDDAGHTRALRPVTPAPAGLTALLELGRSLTCGPGQQWQIWTGTSWFTLPTP